MADVPALDTAPDLLAQQPVGSRVVGDMPNEVWQSLYEHLESSLNSMRMARTSWWTHWAEIARFFLPKRYRFLVTAKQAGRGHQINDAIVDSAGTLALRTCAAGLWTGLTSPSRPWFKLAAADLGVELPPDAKLWLETLERQVYAVFAQSNFYTVTAQGFEDVSGFGTAPLIGYEDDRDVVRWYLPVAGEYFLRVGARGNVDTLYREFTYTLKQVVERFGYKALPEELQEAWNRGRENLDREFVVCHAIEPNFAVAPKGGEGKGEFPVQQAFPTREVYWLKGRVGRGPLSKQGFNEDPLMVMRWSTTSNDPYGRSPGMDALGDQKQVQIETRRKAEFIDKLVRPPMLADVGLKNQPTSIVPGMVTYVSTEGGKKGFQPAFEVNAGGLAPLVEDIEKVTKRIERVFFNDVFMAISQREGVQPLNQLELSKRDLERLQVLGPFITRFENEFASPAILRVIGILERRKLVAPMPKSLRNVRLKLDYVSIMRVAQRQAESVAMKDVFATAGALSSAAKAAGLPDPIRTFDLDKAMAVYADLQGFPVSCQFTADQVAQHDKLRLQAKQAAATPQLAMAGVQAAHTLSQTPVPGGSALDSIMGGGSPTQQ